MGGDRGEFGLTSHMGLFAPPSYPPLPAFFAWFWIWVWVFLVLFGFGFGFF